MKKLLPVAIAILLFANISQAGEQYPSEIQFPKTVNYALNFQNILANLIRDKKLTINKRSILIGHTNFEAMGMEGSVSDPQDKFTQQFFTLSRAVNAATDNDETIKALLKRAYWDKHDRVIWEETISNIIVNEMNRSELFNFKNYNATSAPVRSLNALKPGADYHCEHMALIKGLMTQNIEAKKLHEFGDDTGYKKEYPYYYFTLATMDKNAGVMGHASVFSVATGNITDEENYSLNMVDDYDFEKFKQGEPFYVYSGYHNGSLGFRDSLIGYFPDLNQKECIEKDNRKYFGATQKGYEAGLQKYVQRANESLKITVQVRDILKQDLQTYINDDGKLSYQEISKLKLHLKTYLGTTSLTSNEKSNAGFYEMTLKKGEKNYVIYAGYEAQIPGFTKEINSGIIKFD